MVTLINLKKDNNMITADYYLENYKDDKGHIEYDISRKKVIKYLFCQKDKESKIKYGFQKAVIAIEKLIEYNKFPEKYRYIWY